MNLTKSKHSVYSLHYHIVLVVKYRRKVIDEEMMQHLRSYVMKQSNHYQGELLDLNGEPDHIHILLKLPPTITLSTFICVLKTQTSKEMRKYFFERIKPKLWGRSFWSDSYFVSTTGGANIETLKKYIESQ